MSSFVNEIVYESLNVLLKRSKSESDNCKKNPGSQECEKPSSMSSGAIAATICVPVMFIVVVLGAIMIRAHRLHMKEEKEFANDTEFYKNYDETININEMPAYPPPSYNNNGGGSNSADNLSVDTNGHKDPRFTTTMQHQYDNSNTNLANPFESRENLYQTSVHSPSTQSFVSHPKDDK